MYEDKEGSKFIFNLDHIKDPFFSTEQLASLLQEDPGNPKAKLVNDCRHAMAFMPLDKTGLVIGSGDNSADWIRRGWETLDVDPEVSPSIVADANKLTEIVGRNKYDYLVAERITINREGKKVVDEPALKNQQLLVDANNVLKKGGKFVFIGADWGFLGKLPTAEEYFPLMRKYGFNPVLEVSDIEKFTDPSQRIQGGVGVVWYAEKIKNFEETVV